MDLSLSSLVDLCFVGWTFCLSWGLFVFLGRTIPFVGALKFASQLF